MASKEEYFNMAMTAFFQAETGPEDAVANEGRILQMARYLYHKLDIQSLYRYRPDNGWRRDRDIFESDKIWFQPMSKQNDSLEFSFDIDCPNPLEPFFALCPGLAPLQVATDSLQQQFDNYKNKCLIACFSDSYDNTCLWSGYANSDHGYCISYSVLDVLSQFQYFLLPVTYQERIPTLSEVLANVGNSRSLLPYYIAYKRISTKLIYSEDGRCWADEREWRVIYTLTSDEDSGKAIQFPKPNAVYLGYNAEKPLESEIKEISQKKHIPVFKMKKDHITNKLNPIQIQG